MRIAIGQIDPTVGDFQGNLAKIRDVGLRARAAGASLLVLPEQVLGGYPARDFLDLPAFVYRYLQALDELAATPELAELAIVVGFAEPHRGTGTGLHNAAALLHRGQRLAVARKLLLPNYDVFDEARWFDPGEAVTVVDHEGVRICLTVCEDLWNDAAFWQRRRYPRDPLGEAAEAGAQIVLNLSASPWSLGKPALRRRMLGAAAKRHGLPLVYCNQVGANDSLIFDGHSLVVGPDGEVRHEAAGFAEDLLVVDVEPAAAPRSGAGELPPSLPPPSLDPELADEDLDELLEALTLGVRGYARKSGFRSVLLGLSGGMDSALVAVLAQRALGPENVFALAMPSRYTADISNEDAAKLAENLGIRFESVPIERAFTAFRESLAPLFGEAGVGGLTAENLQARSRGVILMALSNQLGALVLTTGNKSELAVGYCTLYGDMVGGLAPLGDVPKTVVYALARRINREAEIIPERIITRPPSAELREDQTDQDSLPPYEVLDRILHGYIVERLGAEQLVARGEDEATVRRVLSLVISAEHKRRQAAPSLKVTARAFGEGWRFPLAHGFRFR
jgi:NAD+ synthase (glutamine-hydrolysing)